jgi:hypothetical protein
VLVFVEGFVRLFLGVPVELTFVSPRSSCTDAASHLYGYFAVQEQQHRILNPSSLKK